jgi:hypothetical protein
MGTTLRLPDLQISPNLGLDDLHISTSLGLADLLMGHHMIFVYILGHTSAHTSFSCGFYNVIYFYIIFQCLMHSKHNTHNKDTEQSLPHASL